VKALENAVQPDISNAAHILCQRIDNFGMLLVDVELAASIKSMQNKPRFSRLRLRSGGSLDREFGERLDDTYQYFTDFGSHFAEERARLHTTAAGHHGLPSVTPFPSNKCQEPTHQDFGPQMFQSSHNLGFSGGTFYSVGHDVHIAHSGSTAGNAEAAEHLARLNCLLLLQSTIVLF